MFTFFTIAIHSKKLLGFLRGFQGNHFPRGLQEGHHVGVKPGGNPPMPPFQPPRNSRGPLLRDYENPGNLTVRP